MLIDWQLANFHPLQEVSAAPPSSAMRANSDQEETSTSAAGPVMWKKPNPGRYKCNVDAAFSCIFNRTVIGICFRDEEGAFESLVALNFEIHVYIKLRLRKPWVYLKHFNGLAICPLTMWILS